ncbi:MAG TPA: DeoR/GlpR family DNA-binding transcription regulator [Bryobacteraceae bacterium]|nr:DeoR/GlpR family DNA-binding transcription regulator [Bryobacteraceae bacterium]
MNAVRRQLRIRELLGGSEFVDLETLCRELQTSESTVRRDLIALENRRVLKRVHGGALSLHTNNHSLDYAWQSTRRSDEKQRIAAEAANLVEDGQTVILDGGSTVAAVARELVNRSINVITNSLAIAEILKDARQIELTLTGGYLYPRLEVMLGPVCEHSLSGVAADILIMGIGGVTENGLTNNNTLLVGSERKMIEVSRKVMVVADSSKFGHAAMVPVAPLDTVDIVVTDSGLPSEFHDLLERHDIEVRLV